MENSSRSVSASSRRVTRRGAPPACGPVRDLRRLHNVLATTALDGPNPLTESNASVSRVRSGSYVLQSLHGRLEAKRTPRTTPNCRGRSERARVRVDRHDEVQWNELVEGEALVREFVGCLRRRLHPA